MSSRHWQLSGLPFFSLLFRILFVDVFRLRDIFCNFRLAFYLVARLFVITLRAVSPCPLYEPEDRFASYIMAHQVCMSSYRGLPATIAQLSLTRSLYLQLSYYMIQPVNHIKSLSIASIWWSRVQLFRAPAASFTVQRQLPDVIP